MTGCSLYSLLKEIWAPPTIFKHSHWASRTHTSCTQQFPMTHTHSATHGSPILLDFDCIHYQTVGCFLTELRCKSTTATIYYALKCSHRSTEAYTRDTPSPPGQTQYLRNVQVICHNYWIYQMMFSLQIVFGQWSGKHWNFLSYLFGRDAETNNIKINTGQFSGAVFTSTTCWIMFISASSWSIGLIYLTE